MGKSAVSFVCGFLTFLAFFFAGEHNAAAGEPTEQIRSTVDAVIAILNDRELKKPERREERRAKIGEAVEKRFDFEEMAKRSLALHWKDRTPSERAEFVSLFSDLLKDVYLRKVERYEDEKVTYKDERTDGPYATVKTIITTTNNVEIPVDYKIFRKNGRWEVYDIIIEGVSLVNNYRTQFNQIIRSGSYEELVSRIKKKLME